MKLQAHVYIRGDVIGVGFRAWTKIQSKITGVTGWVRNNFEKTEMFGGSGGVEALFQGSEAQIEEMIQLMKQGPPVSRVDEVDVHWHHIKEEFTTFEMRK